MRAGRLAILREPENTDPFDLAPFSGEGIRGKCRGWCSTARHNSHGVMGRRVKRIGRAGTRRFVTVRSDVISTRTVSVSLGNDRLVKYPSVVTVGESWLYCSGAHISAHFPCSLVEGRRDVPFVSEQAARAFLRHAACAAPSPPPLDDHPARVALLPPVYCWSNRDFADCAPS